MEKIAKFEKVSRERFVEDWLDTFGGETEDAKLVYENLKLPKRATKGSAGYDFYSPMAFTVPTAHWMPCSSIGVPNSTARMSMTWEI